MKNYGLKLFSLRLIMVWMMIGMLPVFSGFSDKDEYTVKALFVYNFTKYIEWREQNIQQQFKIGVMGESAIGEKLSAILKGKKLYNRAIEIKDIKTIDEVKGCQILFISKNANDKLKPVLERYSQSETLIVTEDKNMGVKGAGINIIEKDHRMKFEINDAAVKKSGLKVASQLYDLAIVIR